MGEGMLRELYHGNVRPDSRQYSKDSDFMQAVRLRQKHKDALCATLNDRQRELLEQYEDAAADISDISRFDTFEYSLRLGVLLMAEIYAGAEVKGEVGALLKELLCDGV